MIATLAAGAFSFSAHYALWQGRWRWVVRQSQVRTMAALLVGGLALLTFIGWIEAQSAPTFDITFMWATALCTAGFTTVDEALLDQAILLLLIGGMIIGGAGGSTTGGIKAHRAAWLFKGLWRRLVRVWQADERSHKITWNGRDVPPDEANQQLYAAATLVTLYLITLGAGTVCLSLTLEPDEDLQHVLFEATSALSSVGLSTGIASVAANPITKLVLMALMWMGRLEIIAALALFAAPVALTKGEQPDDEAQT